MDLNATPINPSSIYSLKQTIDFIKHQPSPDLTIYLILRLESKQIDPNILLNAVIEIFAETIDLFYLALSIRFGADVNRYVETKQFSRAKSQGDSHGKYHPLVALGINSLERQIDTELFGLAVAILVVSGSDINLPASPYRNTRSSRIQENIVNFYRNNGIPTDDLIHVSQDLKLEKMDSDVAQTIAILLNREDLLEQDNLTDENMVSIVESFSKNLYKYVGLDYTSTSRLVSLAIKIRNAGYLEYAVKEGQEISYIQINELLLMLKKDTNKGDDILAQVDFHELSSLVKYGAKIDKYQMVMLISIVGSKATIIQDLYKEPRWKKECKSKGLPSPELQLIAIGLDLDPNKSKEILCKSIADYSQGLKRSTNVPPTCENLKFLDTNPSEYPSFAIVSYVSKDMTYCFPAELYDTLLDTQINPFNKEPIPIAVLEKMKTNRNILDELGIDPMNVPKFSETLSKLKNPDKIMIDKRAISEFEELLRLYKVAPESSRSGSQGDLWALKNLSPQKAENLLKSLGVEANLRDLNSPDHIRMTLIKESLPIISSDERTAAKFFELYNSS